MDRSRPQAQQAGVQQDLVDADAAVHGLDPVVGRHEHRRGGTDFGDQLRDLGVEEPVVLADHGAEA